MVSVETRDFDVDTTVFRLHTDDIDMGWLRFAGSLKL